MKTEQQTIAIPAAEWLELAGGAKVVRLAAAITLVGTLLYILQIPELGGIGDRRLIASSILIPVSLGALLLLRSGRPVAAYMILLWGALFAITFACLTVAGLGTALIYAYPAVIMGAMALGPRTVLGIGLVSQLAIVGIGTADHMGWLSPAQPPPIPTRGLIYALVLIIMTAVATAMVREQKRWRDKALEANRALEASLQALAERERDLRLVMGDLDLRVKEKTADLTSANRELESFAYSISHDLRAPLRGIDGFSLMALEEYGEKLDAQGRGYLERVRAAAQRMGHLIDDILELSRVSRLAMQRESVDLGRLAAELLEEQRQSDPGHQVEAAIGECRAEGDPRLLRILLQNLIENAWKYSSRSPAPHIAFGCTREGIETVFFVRDNGVGFDMQFAGKLFAPFQRLHSAEEFEGSGVGLATVSRIVHRHGGRVWAEAAPGTGATFRFTLSDKGAADGAGA
ncbi:MAG: hypothetical protein JNL78_11040 [Rhodocyclaceae bacterium]|nr:hypothetical protein [Rhodocyclaceae bacterium]